MKTVFSNQQCAHVWAQQSQSSGRGSSVHFEGDAFYSYNTVIARITTAPSGARVALESSQSYSITTNGKHKYLVGRALHGRDDIVRTYSVPTVQCGGWNEHDLNHAANLAYLLQEYRDLGERLMRITGIYDADESETTARFEASLAVASNYAADFGFIDPTPREIQPASVARQVWARLNSPERVAKREREREAQAAREAVAEARRREEVAKYPAIIAEWRAGMAVTLPYGIQRDADGSAMLRILGDKVQTSLGAEVPLEHAKRALGFYRLMVADKRLPWTRNERATLLDATTVGHFTLDAIDENGELRAGCHVISAAELERFGKLLEGSQAALVIEYAANLAKWRSRAELEHLGKLLEGSQS